MELIRLSRNRVRKGLGGKRSGMGLPKEDEEERKGKSGIQSIGGAGIHLKAVLVIYMGLLAGSEEAPT